MSPALIAALAALNVIIIFVLMAAPLGLRTVRLAATLNARREVLWQALWPLGSDALWSGEFVAVEPLAGTANGGADAGVGTGAGARVKLRWHGRDGAPIERVLRFEDVVKGEGFATVVADDSSLDQDFWANYREGVLLEDAGEGTRVTLSRTDRYRGLAFLAFRYFALRREMARLKSWAETGTVRRVGLFERPLTQVGMAVLSALILWPFFGLTVSGLVLASILTAVVALHELGHMAAFRVAGHGSARMIFIPLLGGIAIGGRPYDTRFEVAFVALMGAGFSAFLVPIAIAASVLADGSGFARAGTVLAMLAGCAALFNVANLVPVWKFDGGQVLRQVCPTPATLALASFAGMAAFLALGHRVGFSAEVLVAAGAVFAILSLLTAGGGAKLKGELKPILPIERAMLALAFAAAFAIHGAGLIWAADRLT
ncbi:MAG: site-2 protease family protein [Rhizobiaceae bacterium]|nr:site-2 protease family protein [Rhizobiaceae bacterium]